MAQCTVTETLKDSLGAAVPNVVVTFTIPAPQMTSSGELMVTETRTATSDATGLVSISLLRGCRALVTCRRLNLDNAPILVPDVASADLGSLLDVGNGGNASLGIPTLQQVLLASDPGDGLTDGWVDAGGYKVYNFNVLEATGADAYIFCQGAGQNTQITAASGNGAGDGILAVYADGNQAHYFQSDRANNRGKISSGGNPFLIDNINFPTNTSYNGLHVKATSTGDMVDGFGASLIFALQDNAGVENGGVASIRAVRDGNDSSAHLEFHTTDFGVSAGERVRITKSGTLQDAAGVAFARADVQVYTTPGSFTWNKPSWAKVVVAECIGAGGGGGGGRAGGAAGTNRAGGSGGGGGARTRVELPASLVGSSETVTVGVGGSAGASGAAGGTGGYSSFGWHVEAGGGGAGFGGTTVDNSGGGGGGGGTANAAAGHGGALTGTAGGTTASTGGVPILGPGLGNTGDGGGGGAVASRSDAARGGGSGGGVWLGGVFGYGGNSSYGAAGGGAGGSVDAANTPRDGCPGGGRFGSLATGGTSGATGTAGGNAPAVSGAEAGYGGGGGGASSGAATAGANGGAGSAPGGGGGGGGAGTGAAGGTGGAGGRGEVRVYCYG